MDEALYSRADLKRIQREAGWDALTPGSCLGQQAAAEVWVRHDARELGEAVQRRFGDQVVVR